MFSKNNGSAKEKVRGYLQDLRGSPEKGHLWNEYKKDQLTRRELKEAVELWITKRTLSREEDAVFLEVVLEELRTA
jgi:predicted XRE-type DNA-binding protein